MATKVSPTPSEEEGNGDKQQRNGAEWGPTYYSVSEHPLHLMARSL